MDDEQMSDMAKTYCVEALVHVDHGNWRYACEALLRRCRELDMTLQRFTPGGSEYVGNPERCAAHIEREINKGREARKALFARNA